MFQDAVVNVHIDVAFGFHLENDSPPVDALVPSVGQGACQSKKSPAGIRELQAGLGNERLCSKVAAGFNRIVLNNNLVNPIGPRKKVLGIIPHSVKLRDVPGPRRSCKEHSQNCNRENFSEFHVFSSSVFHKWFFALHLPLPNYHRTLHAFTNGRIPPPFSLEIPIASFYLAPMDLQTWFSMCRLMYAQ